MGGGDSFVMLITTTASGGIFDSSITSDVLEHKWRASLKTILFLYE